MKICISSTSKQKTDNKLYLYCPLLIEEKQHKEVIDDTTIAIYIYVYKNKICKKAGVIVVFQKVAAVIPVTLPQLQYLSCHECSALGQLCCGWKTRAVISTAVSSATGVPKIRPAGPEKYFSSLCV